MNHEEAIEAVGSDRTYIGHAQRIGSGTEHVRGKILAYQEAPMVLIETSEGQRVWWRLDLTSPAPAPVEPAWRGLVKLADGRTMEGTITNADKSYDSVREVETYTFDFTPD